MATNIGKNIENVILDHIWRFYRQCFQKLDISTAKYQNDILIFCVLVIFYHPFKHRFNICLCSMLAGLLNLQISAQNDIFSILAYFV